MLLVVIMILFMLATTAIFLHNKKIQTLIAQVATIELSEYLQTDIHIGKLEYKFFNKLAISDLQIDDQHGHKMMSVNSIEAQFDLWGFFSKRFTIQQLDLDSAYFFMETDTAGRTPLLCLLDNKRTDAALFLIDRGADTEIADGNGHKAIDYATANGLREVVSRLSAENTSDVSGNTPLHQAVYNGQSEIVRTLLASSKAMLDATNDNGETPLVMACMNGNLIVATLLLNAGADPDKALLNGNAPLHYAALSGNRHLGEALLKAKANPDVRNSNGETPLIVASKQGHNEFVALLTKHNADVNMADNLQHTALYYAGERGYNEIVEMLFENGAEG